MFGLSRGKVMFSLGSSGMDCDLDGGILVISGAVVDELPAFGEGMVSFVVLFSGIGGERCDKQPEISTVKAIEMQNTSIFLIKNEQFA
jgi:hypothetical protein